MKKILFVSARNPFSGRYSGDVIRSLKLINLLKKKYHLDVIYLKKNDLDTKEKNLIAFKDPNIFLKFIYCIVSIFKLEPIQFGLFFSNQIKKFLINNANNYDYLFFSQVRSSQFLPKNYYGKTILDMGDLYSDNYYQTFKNLNFFNPMKYVYFFESLLVKKAEKKIFKNFDRITLFSKKELDKIDKKFKKKIFKIDLTVDKVVNNFSYSPNKSKILFIGNLGYLPNIIACKHFIRKILPKLKLKIPDVKFTIIGNISYLDRVFLSKNKNVEILGPKKNLKTFIKSSYCGLANLNIATGVQSKVLTYMSNGLPVVCHSKVAVNFGKNVLIYGKDNDLIQKLTLLKNKKKISQKYSKMSIKFAKNFVWKRVNLEYLKLFNF